MTLPTGKKKESMILSGEKERLEKEKLEKQEKIAEEKAKQQKSNEEFNQLITDLKKRIEENILYAIKNGERQTEIIIPPNYGKSNYLEAWKKAVDTLQRQYGKEYNFDLHQHTLNCNNAVEAANVDGVSYAEWQESVHRLKINW
jgi:hypothetical protein